MSNMKRNLSWGGPVAGQKGAWSTEHLEGWAAGLGQAARILQPGAGLEHRGEEDAQGLGPRASSSQILSPLELVQDGMRKVHGNELHWARGRMRLQLTLFRREHKGLAQGRVPASRL